MDDFDFGDIFGPEFERFFRDYDRNNDREEQQDEKKNDEPELTYGSGTGFLWDNEGHIVTNNHVIENAVEITVTYSDGTTKNLGSVAGRDGRDGKDGKDGLDGKDGKDGKDGADGKDGTSFLSGNGRPSNEKLRTSSSNFS